MMVEKYRIGLMIVGQERMTKAMTGAALSLSNPTEK